MKSSQLPGRLPRFLQKLGSRILGLLVTFLLGIKLLSACTPPAPITLTFMVPEPEAEQWTSLIEEFEAENPSIRIDLDKGPDTSNELEEVYTSEFQRKEPRFDLVYMDIIWVPKFAYKEWLINLSNLLKEEKEKLEEQEFLENDIKGGYYNGSLYRIPFRSDVSVLYYRKDLLEKTGEQPPETFDELIRISKKLQKPDAEPRWGYLWQGRKYEGTVAMFFEVLKGYDGFWIDTDTHKVGLDQQAAIDAVEFLRSTIHQHRISPLSVTTDQEAETRRLFQNRQAVFLRNWPNVWAQVNATDSDFRREVGIKPMPMVHAEGKSTCQGGWGFGIAKTTKHPKEAWKAIQFFTSAAAQRKFALAGYMPSRRALLIDPQLVKKYSHYPVLLEISKNSVLRPPIPQYAEASKLLQKYLNAALKGELSPEKAMKAVASETRELLKNS